MASLVRCQATVQCAKKSTQASPAFISVALVRGGTVRRVPWFVADPGFATTAPLMCPKQERSAPPRPEALILQTPSVADGVQEDEGWDDVVGSCTLWGDRKQLAGMSAEDQRKAHYRGILPGTHKYSDMTLQYHASTCQQGQAMSSEEWSEQLRHVAIGLGMAAVALATMF